MEGQGQRPRDKVKYQVAPSSGLVMNWWRPLADRSRTNVNMGASYFFMWQRGLWVM